MRQFLNTAGRLREYLVFILLGSMSILLITQSDSAPVQVFRSAAIYLFGTFQSTPSWLGGLVGEDRDIKALRDINMSLLEEVIQLRRLRHENEELRRMLGFMPHTTYPLRPAEIVGKSFEPGSFTITIDVGSSQGIQRNMPVINDQGLVGKILSVSPNYSLVQLAIHRDFRATAKVQRSRVDGIVASVYDELLQLNNVWKTADVMVGDTVITSEYSLNFPAELPIGTVTSIGPGPTGQFSRILIQPRVSFKKLERVFVLLYVPDPARLAAPRPEPGTEEATP